MRDIIIKNIIEYMYIYAPMLILFIVRLIKIFPRPNKRSSIPNLIVTLGVLGTFWGIFLGLLDFNPNDIQASIPKLLEGLQLAFLTSIIGMSLSFVLKILYSFMIWKVNTKNEINTEGATIENLAELLKMINQNQEELLNETIKEDNLLDKLDSLSKVIVEENKKKLEFEKEKWVSVIEKMDKIENSLIGDGDATLITQLQKLRMSFKDKQNEMIKKLKEFSETMAEQNSKAFIKALEEVIRDFNNNLTEQFGENFKELNKAVKKLVDWQENYKEQVHMLTKHFKESVQNINEVKLAMQDIADKSDSLVRLSEELEPILITLDKQKNQTAEFLEEFSIISDKAQKSIPQVDSYIEKTLDGFQKLNLELDTVTTKFDNYIEEILVKTSDKLKDSTETILNSIERQSKLLEKTANDLNDNVEGTMNSVSERIRNMIDENQLIIQEEIKKLDEVLENELNNALESFAGHLATLSEKFAEDYTPLTEKLERVVKIAERVELNE